jgi:uncharacterized protein YbjT (DUF2867 family)
MILVTGATGNVGRAVVGALDEMGAEIRVLVRDVARAAVLPERAERVVGDLGDPPTLRAAFAGVERVFLLTPGMELTHTENAIAAAHAAGVRHLVHLSSTNVLADPLPAMARWHHDREKLVRGSGVPATILRPSGFMTNALEWAPTIRAEGYVLDPVGPGRHAAIDPSDIGEVAARVLTEEGHEDAAYALTGPESLTVAEQVAILARTLGRPIEVREPSTPEEAVRARYANEVPAELAEAMLEGFTRMRADTVGFRTDEVKRLLGREPRSFDDWCTRNADAFR